MTALAGWQGSGDDPDDGDLVQRAIHTARSESPGQTRREMLMETLVFHPAPQLYFLRQRGFGRQQSKHKANPATSKIGLD